VRLIRAAFLGFSPRRNDPSPSRERFVIRRPFLHPWFFFVIYPFFFPFVPFFPRAAQTSSCGPTTGLRLLVRRPSIPSDLFFAAIQQGFSGPFSSFQRSSMSLIWNLALPRHRPRSPLLSFSFFYTLFHSTLYRSNPFTSSPLLGPGTV